MQNKRIVRHNIKLDIAQIHNQGALFIQQKIPVRNFRSSNGTRPTASQSSTSRALQDRAYWVKLLCLKMVDFLRIFAVLEQRDCETISCTILYRNNHVILVAAIACFMRRELTRVNGYFEVTIPGHLSGEFRMPWETCQLLTRNNAHRADSNWQFI